MSYNLGTAAGRIVIDGSGAEKGFGVASKAADSFKQVVQEQLDSINKISNTLIGVGVAGTGAMGLLTNSAAGFEERLSAIQAVSGATDAEMAKIADTALRIGAATKYSASESALAMEELIKAGLSVDDVLNGAADATTNLAAAGELALPRAAEIAANAMNNFNLAGKDMPRIADLIAGAANASAIDVEQFGTSLSQVGAVAALTGMSFDDTAVAIAQMGNAGIKGSDAGTSLKTMLMNLIPTTEKQIAKFQELGIMTSSATKAAEYLKSAGIKPLGDSFESMIPQMKKLFIEQNGLEAGTKSTEKAFQKFAYSTGMMDNQMFDAQGNVKSLAELQDILQKATKDLTKEQQLNTLEIMFGADAIRAAAVMASEGADGYNKMYEAMGNVTAAEVAEQRLNNFKGALEELSGAWETFTISLGAYFLKPAKMIVQALTKIVDVLNSMPDQLKAVIAFMIAFGSSAALFTGIFLKLIPVVVGFIAKMLGLKALRGVFSIFSTGAKVLAGGGGMKAAMLASGAAAGKFGAWIAKLITRSKGLLKIATWAMRVGKAVALLATGPVGWAIAAVAALGLAGKVLYDRWEPFRNLVNRIGNALKDFFVPILESVKSAWTALTDAFSGRSTSGLDGLGRIAANVGKSLRILWENLKDIGEVFMANVMPALKAAGKELGGAFMGAWKSLVSVFQTSLLPAFRSIGEVIVNQVWPALQQIGKALWPIIKIVGMVVAVLVGGFLWVAKQVVMFVVGKLIPALVTFYANVLSKLISALATVGGFLIRYLVTPIIKVIGWILGKLIPAFADLVSFISGVLVGAFDIVRGAIEAVVGWFQSLGSSASEGATAAGSAWTTLTEWIANAWTTVTTFLGNVFSTLAAPFIAFAEFVMPMITAVFGFIGTIISGAMSIIGLILSTAWTIIRTIFEVGALIVWGIIVNLGRLISATWNAIWTTIKTVVGFIWGHIKTVFNAVKAFWSAIWNAIKSVASTVWNGIKSVVTGAVNAVKAVVERVIRGLRATWESIWGVIGGTVKTIWGGIKSVTSGAINAVKSTVGNVMNGIKSAWNTAWTALKTRVSDTWDSVKNFVQRGIDGVKNAFNGAKNWLTSAGRDVINGLVNGIKEKIQAVKDVVSNIGNSIKDGISGILGIRSPSRVMMEYGVNTTEGFMIGLEKNAGELFRMMENMGERTSDPMAYANGSLSAYPVPAAVHSEKGPKTVVQVEWHAAPNDEISTRKQLKSMLGKTTRILGEDVEIS